MAKRLGIADAQRTSARRFDLAAAVRKSPRKYIVLAPAGPELGRTQFVSIHSRRSW